MAWTVIEDAQYMLGGIVAFLEAENEEKLLSFYRDNRFSQFDTRACLKNAFCQMCVTICGRFVPNEGRIAGYVT